MSVLATQEPASGASLAVDLDALFRRYQAELNTFALRRLRDREAAADVVQDAFVRYLVAGATAEAPPASPRFFLWRIVGNLTIDVARRARRRGTFTPLDDIADRLADPRPTAERCLEARQQLALLRCALADMPPRSRAALLLNRLHGMTHAEIGGRLGVSASMVSKYIMTALRHCALRLDPGAA
jgi:RNA polymerase sigma-70 factor (ECF subfamily)